MKKLLSLMLIIFASLQTFAYSALQITNQISMGSDSPPPPSVYGGEVGVDPEPPDQTSIDFIIPLLLISVIILSIYFVKKNEKNKLKSI